MGILVRASQVNTTDTDRIMAEVDEAQQKAQLNSTLREYIAEWRKTREAEEEELKQLKEKQAKRKEIRAEQERKLNQQKKEEEERLKKEEAERKAQEEEELRKAKEEEDAKKKEMMNAQKSSEMERKKSMADGNRLAKTKDQLDDEKKAALAMKIKPLNLGEMDSDEMRAKAEELFNIIVSLEVEKYDYEQKKSSQEQELMGLKEKQKTILRQKAVKKGMDPEAFTERHPPQIRMYSKYERRTDTRTYEDRKKLYEGGWEVIRAEVLDAAWKEKYDDWTRRPAKRLPKWFGERPGKKAGEPESPEGEDQEVNEEGEEEEFEEEEEEEEEYEESEEEEE